MAEQLFDDQFLRRLEYLYLVSRKMFRGRLRAKRRTRIVGSGIEFADYRDYVPGDDLRYLDWNILARMERMLVRLFEEEEDLSIYLLIDCSRSMRTAGQEKLVYAKRLAAALAFVGLSNLNRVSVIPFADQLLDRLPPSRGPGQIFKVLRFLERSHDSATRTDLAVALRSFVAQNRRRGVAIVISDFYDPKGFEEGINALRFQKFEPIVCQVHDETDLEPLLFGDVELVDCETGARVEVTVTRELIKRYREVHRRLVSQVEQFCRAKGAMYFAAPVHLPFEDLVLAVLRSGGFLK
ncbi:MAG: DUF58 domain-containing protein [Bradymonadales bacterium]|nr:DUF58 domain-containing protein [Bradymonadales bacterium]